MKLSEVYLAELVNQATIANITQLENLKKQKDY